MAYAEQDAQKMQDDRTYGIRPPPAPPISPETDSIEALLSQVLSQAFDIKEAISTMRHVFLGAWPENPMAVVDKKEPQGLVPKSKDALYRLIDVQREIREHIVAISKGVR